AVTRAVERDEERDQAGARGAAEDSGVREPRESCGGRNGRWRCPPKPPAAPPDEERRSGKRASMLQDLQKRGLERAERKRCVQAGKEVAADNPFVSQCVPQEVGCRARHQGSHDRGPSAQAKSQALWLAGGEAGLQAGVYALRQKRGERVLQQRVKRR